MGETLVKNFKIASYAGKIINTLTIIRTIVLVVVFIIFATQIFEFTIKEKLSKA
ncbi:MAG: hypothetical protein GX269_01385 [Clostridiales bacterium]|nr:hypothetical protein [Clostridiales bacterium]